LFLDNHLLEVTPGVSRRLHQPTKHLLNPIIRADRWWEGNQLLPYTTMYDRDEKLFKMWCRCGSDTPSRHIDGHAAFTAYLTSPDGIHWDKPSLGIKEISGRRDHNVVFTGFEPDYSNPSGKKGFILPNRYIPQGKKGFLVSVIKHPKPKDERQKYVGLAFVMKRVGAHLCYSPDGLHWNFDPDAPFWQTPHDVSATGDDALMQLLFDHAKQCWVLYRRIVPEFSERMVAVESDRDRKGEDRYDRAFGRAESEDLEHWKNHRFILAMDPDDPPDTELYHFACYNYGPVYVAYMNVFHLHQQNIDVQLATSRDGVNFTRVCRGQAFLPSGPLGYYDFMALATSQPEPIIVNDTVYLYYEAGNFLHDVRAEPDKGEGTGVALATFQRDRFVSLETGEADAGPSRAITKPFSVRHARVYLNATTWERGSIRVAALTPDWQPIAGFTEPESIDIQGNALDFPLRWKGHADLSRLVGREIRLKFYMTRARLYALTFTDEARSFRGLEREDRSGKPADSTPKLI
jgi:hypothetical protein